MNVEITIRRTGNKVEVMQGDATTDDVTCGEVIEQILALVYPSGLGQHRAYPMHTPAEWVEINGKAMNP